MRIRARGKSKGCNPADKLDGKFATNN